MTEQLTQEQLDALAKAGDYDAIHEARVSGRLADLMNHTDAKENK